MELNYNMHNSVEIRTHRGAAYIPNASVLYDLEKTHVEINVENLQVGESYILWAKCPFYDKEYPSSHRRFWGKMPNYANVFGAIREQYAFGYTLDENEGKISLNENGVNYGTTLYMASEEEFLATFRKNRSDYNKIFALRKWTPVMKRELQNELCRRYEKKVVNVLGQSPPIEIVQYIYSYNSFSPISTFL